MIQRIQSVWLLLAAVAAFLTFKVAFFSGNIIGEDKIKVFKQLMATSNLVILACSAILGGITFIAIFFYKNRKLQMRMVLGGLVLSVIILILYYLQAQKFIEGAYNITAIVSLLVPVFLILAARGIRQDQKLVKSLDRLR